MQIRTLLASATAGAILAGLCAATLPAADAATAPAPTTAGTVVAWGDSSVAADTAVPTDLTAPVVDISANSLNTGAVTADGHLKIWGQSTTPLAVLAPSDVTDAAAIALDPLGSNALVLHTDGTVTGWSATTNLTPDDPGMHAKAIALGNSTAYAVAADGTLVTWGAPVTIPERVSSLTDLVDVSYGQLGGLALRANGTAVAWGMTLPDAGDPYNTLPTDIGGHKVVQISAGGLSNGVLLDDGTIRTWGYPGAAVEQRTFPGKTVKSLVVGIGAAVVLEDAWGHRSVDLWGNAMYPAVTDPARAEDLDGEPVAKIALADTHAAAIVTGFREATKPTVSGTPIVGATLTATPATYSVTPDAPATGQWFAGADPIAGQTGPTLALGDALLGKTISYHNSATRHGETVTSVSAPVGPIAAKRVPAVTLAASAGTYGTASTVTVTVADATGDVAVTLDGTSVGTRTLDGGQASFSLATTTAPGSHTLTATYGGSATVAAANGTATLTVAKGSSGTPVLKVTKPRSKAKGKVTVTVTTAAGLAPATGKAQVVLKKGKSTKKVNLTLKNGKAVGSLPKLPKGTWKATVTYQGSAYYVPVKSKTLTVKSK